MQNVEDWKLGMAGLKEANDAVRQPIQAPMEPSGRAAL